MLTRGKTTNLRIWEHARSKLPVPGLPCGFPKCAVAVALGEQSSLRARGPSDVWRSASCNLEGRGTNVCCVHEEQRLKTQLSSPKITPAAQSRSQECLLVRSLQLVPMVPWLKGRAAPREIRPMSRDQSDTRTSEKSRKENVMAQSRIRGTEERNFRFSRKAKEGKSASSSLSCIPAGKQTRTTQCTMDHMTSSRAALHGMLQAVHRRCRMMMAELDVCDREVSGRGCSCVFE